MRRAGESTATVLQKEKAGRSLARSLARRQRGARLLPEEKRKGGPPPFHSRSQPTPHPGAMACGATLKRTIDFDPLLSPPSQSPKRRRCTPLNSASSPQKYLKMQPSPFGEVTPRLTTGWYGGQAKKGRGKRSETLCRQLPARTGVIRPLAVPVILPTTRPSFTDNTIATPPSSPCIAGPFFHCPPPPPQVHWIHPCSPHCPC